MNVEWQRRIPSIPNQIRYNYGIGIREFKVYNHKLLFGGVWCPRVEDERRYPWIEFLLGEYNMITDEVEWIRNYGDSLRYEMYAENILIDDENIILTGVNQDYDDRESRRIAVLYLNHDGDSIDFVEEEYDRDRYPWTRGSYLCEDGTIDYFVEFNNTDPLTEKPVEIHKFSADHQQIDVIQYEIERDFGCKSIDIFPRCKTLNGDYLLVGSASFYRYQENFQGPFPGKGECIVRINSAGEILWMNNQVDSMLYRFPNGNSAYIFNQSGYMLCAIEDAVGNIYASGTKEPVPDEIHEDDYSTITIYKYNSRGELIWEKRYNNDNRACHPNDSRFNYIFEISSEVIAVFGRIEYRGNDERVDGIYGAIMDTSGNILYDTFIRGDGIDNEHDYIDKMYSIDNTTYLAELRTFDRYLLITVDLDDPSIIWEPIVSQPNALTLYPSYPNPFNSTSRVTFSLPSASEVRLTLSDMQGRTVSELLNGQMLPGMHQVQLNGSDLPAGVYVINLNAGDVALRRKAVVVK